MNETHTITHESVAAKVLDDGSIEVIKENEPNIIFIRKVESKGETVDAEPPDFIVEPGGMKIKLPSADEQLAGFYHEKAGQIIQAMPKSFKAFRPSKGVPKLESR